MVAWIGEDDQQEVRAGRFHERSVLHQQDFVVPVAPDERLAGRWARRCARLGAGATARGQMDLQ